MPLAFHPRRELRSRRDSIRSRTPWVRLAAVVLAMAALSGRAEAAAPAPAGPDPHGGGIKPLLSPLASGSLFRFESGLATPGEPAGREGEGVLEIALPRHDWSSGRQDLLGRYRKALERECERRSERDPTLGWAGNGDDEGYPARRTRREAERIFDGANSRLLSHFLERVVEQAAALRAARDYVDGLSLDVRKGGGVHVAHAHDEADDAEKPVTRFTLVAIGSPRLEMRSRLPRDLDARVELSLSNPGVSASLTRRFTRVLKGRLGAGIEDSGQDRWISAGVEIRF